MYAIRVVENGEPDVLCYAETAVPEIGAGRMLVAVSAIGVNYIDTYLRRGIYPTPLPYIPGIEGAGIVVELGPEVTDFAVGDRVAWCDSPGSYAEFISVPATRCIKLPAALSEIEAAGFLLQGLTAHYLIHSIHSFVPGDTILIHAGGGGTGLFATQLAKILGLTVITTVSSDEKEKLSRAAGADHVLRYGDSLVEQVHNLTNGVGVCATFDGVGAATFQQSLKITQTRGTVILFGAASGPVPLFDIQQLNVAGSLKLTRPTLAHFIEKQAEFAWRTTELMNHIESGALKITVGKTYPLNKAAQAHRELEARTTVGSLVLLP